MLDKQLQPWKRHPDINLLLLKDAMLAVGGEQAPSKEYFGQQSTG